MTVTTVTALQDIFAAASDDLQSNQESKSIWRSLGTWISINTGVWRIFSKRAEEDFSRRSQNGFPGWAKSDKISLYPHETKKTTFFSKKLIGINVKFQTQRGWGPHSDAHAINISHYYIYHKTKTRISSFALTGLRSDSDYHGRPQGEKG